MGSMDLPVGKRLQLEANIEPQSMATDMYIITWSGIGFDTQLGKVITTGIFSNPTSITITCDVVSKVSGLSDQATMTYNFYKAPDVSVEGQVNTTINQQSLVSASHGDLYWPVSYEWSTGDTTKDINITFSELGSHIITMRAYLTNKPDYTSNVVTFTTITYPSFNNGWNALPYECPSFDFRESHSCELLDGRAFICGNVYNSVTTWIADEFSITQVANCPHGRDRYTQESSFKPITLDDGRVFVIGGDGGYWIDIYNPDTNIWQSIPNPIYVDSQFTDAKCADGRVWVYGGYMESRCFYFNPTTNTASTPIDTGINGKHASSIGLDDGSILVAAADNLYKWTGTGLVLLSINMFPNLFNTTPASFVRCGEYIYCSYGNSGFWRIDPVSLNITSLSRTSGTYYNPPRVYHDRYLIFWTYSISNMAIVYDTQLDSEPESIVYSYSGYGPTPVFGCQATLRGQYLTMNSLYDPFATPPLVLSYEGYNFPN